MSDHPAELLEASFIQSSKGHLFCIKAQPWKPASQVHNVLFVPPFAEELNTSRRFFSLIRRALCNQGYSVIQPDLYGTGDSEGIFVDATWDTWLEDLRRVQQVVCSRSAEKMSVVALRSGCLLAQEFLLSQEQSINTMSVEKLLYLQPETSGFDVINTLLRMQAARNRLSSKPSETCASLWKKFEDKQSLHVGGYDIGHELALQMRDTVIAPDAAIPVERREWINLSSGSDTVLDSNVWCEHTIASTPFWQSHEIEPKNHTIEAIAALFNG